MTLDGQSDEAPFQIVLVDIKKTVKEKQVHCVQVPLTNDLKYVALSYRWGELTETVIDTGFYMACITSFDLDDFYLLCYMMTKEQDLKTIGYVWVDTICVDQTNYERKKATIHAMSSIYHQASYILAVPDMNRASVDRSILKEMRPNYYETFYHAVHGNVDETLQAEQAWVDKYEAGLDPDAASKRSMPSYHRHRRSVMTLLCDYLIARVEDWASRVWVMSEYNIAAQKQRIKYWFLELTFHGDLPDPLVFFEYYFDPWYNEHRTKQYPTFEYDYGKDLSESDNYTIYADLSEYLARIHLRMDATLVACLSRKTYPQMMLESKASKDEDRLYSILPLTKYKPLVKDLKSWDFSSMVALKLRLFEFMDTTDKLELLYASAHGVNTHVLPTFATVTIEWPPAPDLLVPDCMENPPDISHPSFPAQDDGGNYDLDRPCIVLTDTKLHIEPLTYYIRDTTDDDYLPQNLRNRLDLHDDLNLVCISSLSKTVMEEAIISTDGAGHNIFLYGSFAKNKWVLTNYQEDWGNYTWQVVRDRSYSYHTCDEYTSGFDIY